MSHSGPSIYTGFGDNPATSAKFGILRNRDGTLPNWVSTARLVQEPVAVSTTRVITQSTGRAPYTITMRLWFPTLDDYTRMDALQGMPRHTLRYLWGITKPIGGEHWRGDDGVDYLVLPDVLLVSLDDETVRIDGTAEATATFQRAYHDPTLRTYGPYPAAPDPEAT